MKKLFFLALLMPAFLWAQDETTSGDSSDITGRHNEVRTDLVAIVYYSRLNLSYERFIDEKWSAGLSAGLANSTEIDNDFERGYRNNRPRYDVTPFVRYKLSKGTTSFYFAEVFLSANSGDYKEIVRIVDTDGTAYYANEKSDFFDLGAGGGLGYKFYFKDQFAIELLVSVGANLLDTEKSPDVLSRTGLSIGYRF